MKTTPLFLKKLAISTLFSAMAFFTPVKTVLFIIGFLVFADLATGIIKSRHKKEQFSWSRFKDKILHGCLYILAVLCGFCIEFMVDFEWPIAKIIGCAICVGEFFSIITNIETILGRKLILKSLRDKLEPKKE